MPEISLYCPRCADRIKRKALAMSFDEPVTCPTCATKTPAGRLLTDEGKTLVDYLALQSVQAAKNKPKLGDPA